MLLITDLPDGTSAILAEGWPFTDERHFDVFLPGVFGPSGYHATPDVVRYLAFVSCLDRSP